MGAHTSDTQTSQNAGGDNAVQMRLLLLLNRSPSAGTDRSATYDSDPW